MTSAEIAGAWLGLVYARPDWPPIGQRDVLVTLAVHSGCAGSDPDKQPEERRASEKLLREICGASISTIRRALRWAQKAALLVRLQRGHYVADGVAVPSTWRMVIT